MTNNSNNSFANKMDSTSKVTSLGNATSISASRAGPNKSGQTRPASAPAKRPSSPN